MLSIRNAIAKINLVCEEEKSSCDLVIFYMKLALTQITFESGELIIDDSNSVTISYGEQLDSVIVLILETLTNSIVKKEYARTVELQGKKVIIKGDSKNSPYITVSKFNDGLSKIIFELFTKKDILEFLKSIKVVSCKII